MTFNTGSFENASSGSLRAFMDAYIEAALWSSHDDDGAPLGQYDGELSTDTRAAMERDCAAFHEAHSDRFGWGEGQGSDEQGGHDFWLTRNHHGAGFWDREELWGVDGAKVLTDASHAFGEYDLYIGDDGLIHGAKG